MGEIHQSSFFRRLGRNTAAVGVGLAEALAIGSLCYNRGIGLGEGMFAGFFVFFFAMLGIREKHQTNQISSNNSLLIHGTKAFFKSLAVGLLPYIVAARRWDENVYEKMRMYQECSL